MVAVLTRHHCCRVLFRLESPSLTSSTLSSGGVLRYRPTYDDVADKVAVRPDVQSRQVDRGPPSSTCREPAAEIRAIRYASCCCVSVNRFSCRRLFSFSWPTLPNCCSYALITLWDRWFTTIVLIIDSLMFVDQCSRKKQPLCFQSSLLRILTHFRNSFNDIFPRKLTEEL